MNNISFEKGIECGTSIFIARSKVLIQNKQAYLPQDTLTICCRMWMTDEGICDEGQIFARTRIQFENISFVHKIEGFDELEKDQEETVDIESSLGEKLFVSIGIFEINDPCCEEKIVVEIIPEDKDQIEVISCMLHLMNASRETVKCGQLDNRFDLVKKEDFKVPLIFSKKMLIDGKTEYLPYNTLTLRCDCTFSTGLEFEKIEKAVYGLHLMPDAQTTQNGFNELSNCPTALEDFTYLYKEQILTDVKLQTKTKTFSSHKTVLIARSLKFRSLLVDEKKKTNECIDVSDLDDETVERLLLFFYNDVVKDLQYDSAYKLLKAAEIYKVQRLKMACTSFLMDNLNTSNACKLLVLADMYQDLSMKTTVEDFILEHEEEIFRSDSWEEVMDANPTLAMKTMHLKFKKKGS
ncbi:speckle-type POZ protein B [Caerostris darwini]|uniref:Speckle-type POZ protein B n=1 Tax=Caerostris darwini TaxID=1538125 RepID=A0AAV4SP57_9ARAC|nr:speckle-type POZ protein B [Caerostris darwini]